MNFISIFYVILLYFWNVFLSADATAMLKPSHRGTMWTRTNYNSAGYNYMGINCGGIGRLKQNNGKCGLCGDPFNGVRKHESGGKYATGAIADVIDKGQRNIYVKILLNSDQGGYFEFHLCVTNGTAETKACFDKHLLKISEGRNQGDQFAYYVDRAGIIPLTVEVPDGVYCDRCVLQWKYVTGNTFGRDEHGVGCLGCGHQETYINCADITIKGWEIPTTPVPPTTPIPTTVWWTTTVAPTTRPPPPPPTTTTPTPTTRAPSTTAAKVVQITKAKVITKNTQPSNRQFTRQRRPATDFDEGSRRRSQYNRYPDAQGSVPAQAVAPKKQAIVPASVFRSNSLDSSHNRHKDIAVQPKVQPAVAIVPEKVATTTVKILPEVKEIKPSILPKRQSGPFKIPRPPRLTFEQIDALNNKNGQPGHDPLQKYANVGSSRLIAAVDFTTVRAQQVATPPTTSKLDKFNQRSTDSTVNIHKVAKSALSAEKTPDLFSSFGNEMLGAPPQLESAAQPTQNFGMDLINEYGIIPSVSPRGKFVSQMKDRNNNRGTHSNEFSSSNSIRQNSQVSQNMNHMQKKTQGNRHFSAGTIDLQHGSSLSSNPRYQPQSQSNMQQISQDRYTLKAKQSYSPEQLGAAYVPETNIFRGSESQTGFRNSNPNQNVYNTGSVSRYGQMSNMDSNSNTYNQHNNNNEQQQQHNFFNQKAMPMKTTKLPVVDTSTHQTEKKTKSHSIAPWRDQHLKSSRQENAQSLQDKPVNLFKDKKRNNFKPPVVFERFTNYQVGGSKKEPNIVPESLMKANQIRKQETLQHTVVSNDSHHLNTGLHSPEQYFGQDHYIAHDVELSNQAFGGPNSPDYQPQVSQNLDKVKDSQIQAGWQSQGSQLQADWQSSQQVAQSQNGWQSQQNSPLQGDWQSQQDAAIQGGWQSQQALPLQVEKQSQSNWHSNAMSQTQSGWQTHDTSQSFANDHLNAALHSPTNYFPQFMQQGQPMNMPYQPFWNPTAAPEPPTTTTQRTTTTTTTTTQAPTTTRRPTTQAAPTTDIIQYQMNELKKLREKMERLQTLLLQRNKGAEVSTSFNPTQISKQTYSNQQIQKGVSQSTVYVPHSFNKKTIYVDPQNAYNNNNNNNNNMQQKNRNNEIPTAKISGQYDVLKQTSTVPPEMTKETTKYIHNLKTQMLQSIKRANEYKKQQMSPPSEKALRTRQNDIYDTKPYNNERASQATERNINDHHRQQQKNGLHGANTKESPTKRNDEEKRQKYRRILELLIERKKQKAAEQQKVRQEQVSQPRPILDVNPPPQNPYEQSLQHKPALAEMKTNYVKKERIVQDPRITSVRPIETIQTPATEIAAESNIYQPNAVKTTIDKLADRLAAGMAEKLSSTGNGNGRNFHVLPLSSDSVMAALRNIAAKVLKRHNQSNTPTSETNIDKNHSQRHQNYEKPTLGEIHISKGVERQEITTELNKHSPHPTLASQMSTTTERKRVHTGDMSPEKLARRKELIRKMKEIMLRRKQRLHINTKTRNGNHPDDSKVRPTETSQIGKPTIDVSQLQRTTDVNQFRAPIDSTQQILSNSPSYMTSNRKSVQKDNVSNNDWLQNSNVDQTTFTNNRSPTTHNQIQQTSHKKPRRTQQIVTGMSPTSTQQQYSNNNQNEGSKAKMRMSPDIARSMLSRVRSMLASQKSNDAGGKNIEAMSNKDVLVMPLNKEMLFKLLQSMKNKQANTGR